MSLNTCIVCQNIIINNGIRSVWSIPYVGVWYIHIRLKWCYMICKESILALLSKCQAIPATIGRNRELDYQPGIFWGKQLVFYINCLSNIEIVPISWITDTTVVHSDTHVNISVSFSANIYLTIYTFCLGPWWWYTNTYQTGTDITRI